MNTLAESNVLLPPIDELILGTIAFILVFWALSKFALPGIKKALEERTAAIEGGIQRAEARTEAAQIRAQAQADKLALVEEAKREAADAAAAVTARADAAITAERASTVASLHREVGNLAVSLAGKVVGESLEDDARARATIDRFIADLESQASGAGH